MLYDRKSIRQAFEVGSLLRLTFSHVLVGLVHGRPLNGVEPNSNPLPMPVHI
jgi:hypothetical protein